MIFEYAGVALVPILIAVGELLKRVGINSKAIPIINVILGILLGVIINRSDMLLGVLSGLCMGLMSVGLYSSATNTWENLK
jgi:uncharacterized membrane protein